MEKKTGRQDRTLYLHGIKDRIILYFPVLYFLSSLISHSYQTFNDSKYITNKNSTVIMHLSITDTAWPIIQSCNIRIIKG